MPHLIGQKIMLRDYRSDDYDSIRSWVNDGKTTRYLSTRFWPAQTSVDTDEFLHRMLQSSHNAFHFVIAEKDTEKYLGQLDMFRVDWRLRQGEIGMVIARAEDRGLGYGAEALLLLAGFAFQTLGLERIELDVHMENAAAISCYKKAGFVLEGVKRRAFFNDGHFSDIGIMSLIRPDWETNTKKTQNT